MQIKPERRTLFIVSEGYPRNPNCACKICGVGIYRRPSVVKMNNGHVFCSIKCYSVSNRKESPCVVCHRPIMAHFNKKTCSRRCANMHRAGIKYKLGSPRSKVSTYIALKKKLIETKGNKCEKCGYTKVEILQVHHKDRDRSNNNLENLELICPNCHYEEHYLQRSLFRQVQVGQI